MENTEVKLVPLTKEDREQFISDNQWAFWHGGIIEFGECSKHIYEPEQIISRETISACMDEKGNETYRIIVGSRKVGGIILKIDKITNHNHLELFFVNPDTHSKGVGCAAWKAAEALHPETKIWETCTPYFEKRNIRFYVNKCGFHIVEFLNKYSSGPSGFDEEKPGEGPEEMFRFIKVME